MKVTYSTLINKYILKGRGYCLTKKSVQELLNSAIFRQNNPGDIKDFEKALKMMEVREEGDI